MGIRIACTGAGMSITRQGGRREEAGKGRTDDDALGEELRLDDALPEEEGVLEAVDAAVLGEELVEARDGREEQDRVRVVEVREPRRALSTHTPHPPPNNSSNYTLRIYHTPPSRR